MRTTVTPLVDLDLCIDLNNPEQLAAWCRYLGMEERALVALVTCFGADASIRRLLTLDRPLPDYSPSASAQTTLLH